MASKRQRGFGARVVNAAGSLLTSLLVFAATPAVLVVVVGYPLGTGLGHQWNHLARLALSGVALVAWVAWLACCTQLVRSVITQVRRGHADSPVGAVLTERVAGKIAAGVLSLIAVAAPLLVASGAGATNDRGGTSRVGMDAPRTRPSPGVVVRSTAAAPAPVQEVEADPAAPVQSSVSSTYVVRPGDSLWSIAEEQLGDGGDWPAIAALNLGHTMSDGLRFVDPSLIHAGWRLSIPEGGGQVVSQGREVPPNPLLSVPNVPTSPTPRTTTAPMAPDAPVTTGTGAHQIVRGTPRPVPTFPAVTAMVAPGAGSFNGARGGRLRLPELSALGIGAIACGALARRSRRMRVLRQMTEGEPSATEIAEPSPDAVDTDILLSRFSGIPALHAFEAANYQLGFAADQDRSFRLTAVRAVSVGAAGVDFWLAESGRPAPSGFSLSDDGQAWPAAHDTFVASVGARPFLPIVLPVGDDENGTWLLPLAPGSCLPLIGEERGDLWRAARYAQEAWLWADLVLITEDPVTVTAEVALLEDGDGSADASQILFFGDPASLSAAVAQKVAIVTTSGGSATDVTVLVDSNAASIHPLGRTVRPHLMGAEVGESVGQLVTLPARVEAVLPPDDEEGTNDAVIDVGPRAALLDAPAIPTSGLHISIPDPGIVEVKLLTATPRLDGLRQELASNRARRAVELVAYLALHAGEEVTSDRLRTRVLGSADADAASKTLFNIAAAARRAMGSDGAGVPLFPPGTRTGIYRVSTGVSVDVYLAGALAAEGSATENPDAAMALLRSALSLVEGEPLANALAGYGWWEAEGHGARLAAVLVHAAGDLAALAVKAGHFDLAQWGLGQARLVDPYSEALSRVAMQVAAAAGDADRLRREWHECQRRIDELDPGSSPSPRTERLYGELKQRVLVGAVDPTRHE